MLARAAIELEEACWGEGTAHRAALDLLEEASDAIGGVGIAATDRSAVGPRSCARPPRRPRPRRGHSHQRDRDGAPARRPAGPCDPPLAGLSAGGTSTLEDTLAMLTEAAALGGRARRRSRPNPIAMGWRVVALIALGELEAARRDLARVPRASAPHEAAVPFLCSRALRVDDRAVRRSPGGGRSQGGALA